MDEASSYNLQLAALSDKVDRLGAWRRQQDSQHSSNLCMQNPTDGHESIDGTIADPWDPTLIKSNDKTLGECTLEYVLSEETEYDYLYYRLRALCIEHGLIVDTIENTSIKEVDSCLIDEVSTSVDSPCGTLEPVFLEFDKSPIRVDESLASQVIDVNEPESLPDFLNLFSQTYFMEDDDTVIQFEELLSSPLTEPTKPELHEFVIEEFERAPSESFYAVYDLPKESKREQSRIQHKLINFCSRIVYAWSHLKNPMCLHGIFLKQFGFLIRLSSFT
ncbi:hypothetical protein M5689_010987 [Euphorbia peplus]|nr:hypothetical protein M5689_010987 [Euphorbia peplus]